MYHRGDLSVLADFCAGEDVTIGAEGSGFRSVTIVGFLEAINQTKCHAKAYAAVSGSAGPIASHMAGQSDGTFEVYKKLAKDGCITWEWKWVFPYGWLLLPTYDHGKLIHEIESNLDVRALQKNPSQLGLAVLRYTDGKGEILEGKDDPLTKISATTSIPGMCTPVTINGVPYVDGINIRITPAARKYWARKILVLRSRRRWWWEEVLYPHIVRCNFAALPAPLARAVATADMTFERELERLRTCERIRYLEIGPDDDDPFLWQWCRDIEMLTKMRDNARDYMLRLIDKALTVPI